MEERTTWELVNPAGVVKVEPFNVKSRPGTLDGKTVLLRWNGKHNGDVFLNRIAELLTENVKDVEIIKSWEVAPETATSSRDPNTSKELTEKLATFKPDIAIGSQGD